jgi:cell division transport system ATP-binding protein
MPSSPASAADTASASDTARLLGVGFGYADAPEVLRDVNLILPRGSFHFLTGRSGAGKSSLLRLLTLAERPKKGRISLFGADVTTVARRDIPAFRRRMGVVFQDFHLVDHLSAFENAALPLRLAHRREADYAGDVEEMLKWVGLGGRMDARPPALSGGEKQRLAIARAVITQPSLIIADEPTGSVDAVMADKLLRLFQSLNRLGATVLIASHDEALAARSGARVLRLEQGRLAEAEDAAA